MFIFSDVEIGYLDVALFTDSESDLVPNVYEGGFKSEFEILEW